MKSFDSKGEKNMEEFKVKLKDMDNEQLKDHIIEHNNVKLNNIKRSSYLNAFGAVLSITSIMDRIEEFDYLKGLSELDLFKDYMNLAIKLINESVDEEKTSQQLEKAKKTRNEIYELLKIVESYYIELSYVGSMVDHYGLMLKSKEYNREYSSINIEKVISLIHDKLEEYKSNYSMYNHIVSQIIQFIPIRLTKDKYINIIENSVSRNLKPLNKNQIEDRINYYKRQWDSSIQYGYGSKFDHYFAEIQKLKNEDIKNKNLSELDEMVNTIIDITRDINELYNFILISGLVYNMIIVIYLTDKEPLDREILELKKQWNSVLSSKDENEIQEFMKSNETIIKEVEESMTEDIDEFQELNKEAVVREDVIDDELEEVFEYTKEVLTYYNDYNLNNIDSLLSQNMEKVSDLFLDEWVNSLSSYIKRTLSHMDNVERKARMKKLLSLVELPFASIGEFEDYIRYSLNSRVSSSKETLFIIENMVGFIQNIDKEDNID